MKHWFPLFMLLGIVACNGEIYLRDGVTDGDTFYLANRTLADSDPALQSWASYSLTRSACQLAIGGSNPARASSFDCELTARRHLLETWHERRGVAQDEYLDRLDAVDAAGYLDEYVAHFFGKAHWNIPAGLRSESFNRWRRDHLRGHRPETRIVGSWGYGPGGRPD